MLWTRGLAVWEALVLGCAGAVGAASNGASHWASGAADEVDPGFDDRRGAVRAASNVFIGRVVGERLYCLATSAPDLYVVYEHFLVDVERNLKGRVTGRVLVRQDTDDTLQFGPDGRMRDGEKYLLLVRPLWQAEGYAVVDYRLGYAHIAEPEKRAALTAEIRGYLAEPPPVVDTPTPIPPDTRATWDANGTVFAATHAAYPTPFPCGPEVLASATAYATYLADGERGIGDASGPPPANATPYPTG